MPWTFSAWTGLSVVSQYSRSESRTDTGDAFVRKFLAFVLLCVCLEFGLVVGILYLGYLHDATHPKAEADNIRQTEPPHRSERYLTWYLASLWDTDSRTPDNPVLAVLYERTNAYVTRYITPNTGETPDAAMNRITASLGPAPTDLEIHSSAVREAYAASGCRESYSERCYLLDFSLWTLSSEVLPALGATVSYSSVLAGDYEPAWIVRSQRFPVSQ